MIRTVKFQINVDTPTAGEALNEALRWFLAQNPAGQVIVYEGRERDGGDGPGPATPFKLSTLAAGDVDRSRVLAAMFTTAELAAIVAGLDVAHAHASDGWEEPCRDLATLGGTIAPASPSTVEALADLFTLALPKAPPEDFEAIAKAAGWHGAATRSDSIWREATAEEQGNGHLGTRIYAGTWEQAVRIDRGQL